MTWDCEKAVDLMRWENFHGAAIYPVKVMFKIAMSVSQNSSVQILIFVSKRQNVLLCYEGEGIADRIYYVLFRQILLLVTEIFISYYSSKNDGLLLGTPSYTILRTIACHYTVLRTTTYYWVHQFTQFLEQLLVTVYTNLCSS